MLVVFLFLNHEEPNRMYRDPVVSGHGRIVYRHLYQTTGYYVVWIGFELSATLLIFAAGRSLISRRVLYSVQV